MKTLGEAARGGSAGVTCSDGLRPQSRWVSSPACGLTTGAWLKGRITSSLPDLCSSFCIWLPRRAKGRGLTQVCVRPDASVSPWDKAESLDAGLTGGLSRKQPHVGGGVHPAARACVRQDFPAFLTCSTTNRAPTTCPRLLQAVKEPQRTGQSLEPRR